MEEKRGSGRHGEDEVDQVDQLQTCKNPTKNGTWPTVANLANFLFADFNDGFD